MAVQTTPRGDSIPLIVTTGLPGDLSRWLEGRLGAVGVRPLEDAEEAVQVAATGSVDLMIINHTLSGPAALDVLSRVRANPRLSALPVIYLLDRHLDSHVGRELLQQLGVDQLLLHPIDREEMAAGASRVLQLPPPDEHPLQTVEQVPVVAPPAPLKEAEQPVHGLSPREDRAFLLIVNGDEEAGGRIAEEAVTRGLRAEVITQPGAARDFARRERPDVVLLDLTFSSGPDDGLSLLKDLSTQVPPIPVLVAGDHDTFLDRVQVASLRGRGFLPKHLAPAEVLDWVARVLQELRATESHVMAVDDDPETLAVLRGLLEAEGISVTTVSDPLRFWDTLEDTTPDLVMIDLDMPRLSGVELCRVVRNDARWSALPVLFLTNDVDRDTRRTVFAAGADGFVSKPLLASELLTTVMNRLERTLLYRSLAEIDPVTGVTNRWKSTQSIRQLLRLAERQKVPLSVALLDVDLFKQINDQFGHAAGDAVLQQLGKLLLRTFRSEDVVARWGGEEFLIGMYGMTRADGVQRLAHVLEQLRLTPLVGPRGERISISFSAGVALFPEDGTDLQSLTRSADAALYAAKAAGRDRILPVGLSANGARDGVETVDVALIHPDETQGPFLTAALEQRGYRTCWLQDSDIAVQRLTGMSPTLCASVIVLGGGGSPQPGLRVLNRLESDGLTRRTRVIMLMDRASDADLAHLQGLGVFDAVAPHAIPALLQRVRRALEVL